MPCVSFAFTTVAGALRARSLANKATLNTAIKTAIERIKTDFLPTPELDSCETVKP
jgi:hypothetical protein